MKTVWILISWLHQKPADLDLQCFQKQMNLGSAGQELIDLFNITDIWILINKRRGNGEKEQKN